MWRWNSPITVNSHSVIVLEVQFPGGFDSQINPGEFVLTSVDAQFKGELNSNINDREPPSSGMPQPATTDKHLAERQGLQWQTESWLTRKESAGRWN